MNIQELTKTYDGKTVVDSVSFEIPKGKVLSLIGEAEWKIYCHGNDFSPDCAG